YVAELMVIGVTILSLTVVVVCSGGALFFFFQAEDGIRDATVTGVQTCALPISSARGSWRARSSPPSRPSPGTWRGDNSGSAPPRSEERRVGKECRSRWAPTD